MLLIMRTLLGTAPLETILLLLQLLPEFPRTVNNAVFAPQWWSNGFANHWRRKTRRFLILKRKFFNTGMLPRKPLKNMAIWWLRSFMIASIYQLVLEFTTLFQACSDSISRTTIKMYPIWQMLLKPRTTSFWKRKTKQSNSKDNFWCASHIH